MTVRRARRRLLLAAADRAVAAAWARLDPDARTPLPAPADASYRALVGAASVHATVWGDESTPDELRTVARYAATILAGVADGRLPDRLWGDVELVEFVLPALCGAAGTGDRDADAWLVERVGQSPIHDIPVSLETAAVWLAGDVPAKVAVAKTLLADSLAAPSPATVGELLDAVRAL